MLVFTPAVRRLRQHLPEARLEHLVILEEIRRSWPRSDRPFNSRSAAASTGLPFRTLKLATMDLANAGLITTDTLVMLTDLGQDLIDVKIEEVVR